MASPKRTLMWQDDLWAVVAALPIVYAFTPHGAQHVREGMAALDTAPDWYIWVVGTTVGFACYRRGFRGIRTILPQRPRIN